MAPTFGSYVDADLSRALRVGAVVALTVVNLLGVQKTAWLTRVIVPAVLSLLAVEVSAGLTSWPSTSNIGPLLDGGLHGIVQAEALLFFAFADYARIATLGEEVRDPAHTIPRAIPIALGITLVVYATVAVVALCTVGPNTLATSSAPLIEVAAASGRSWAVTVVRGGAAVASLGVLLSLLVGVSRTTFAMAGEADLPRWLDAVHSTRRVPHRSELIVVIAVVLVADVRGRSGSALSPCSSAARLPTSRVHPHARRASKAQGVGHRRARRVRIARGRPAGEQRDRRHRAARRGVRAASLPIATCPGVFDD